MVANFSVLKHVSQQLHLRMEPDEQARWTTTALLSGVVDGTYVEIEQWQADFVHVYVRAHLTPPADLGLTVEPAGVGAKIGELLGKHDVHVGDEAFDDAFLVHASDEERAKQLFTPEVKATLMDWKKAGVDFVVTDESVFLTLPMVPLWGTGALTTRDVIAPEDLLANLRATVALAKTLDGALRALPPSSLLARQAGAFRAYAAAHGLAFSASPLEVHGHMGGARFFVHPRVGSAQVTAAVSLRFDVPLPATIRVRPRSQLDLFERLKSLGKSSVTGDTAFDAVFHVLVADASPAAAWLTEPVRHAMVALQEGFADVELDRRGITLATRGPTEPAAFAGLLDRACQLERSLREAVTAAR
jgi:hypothetical protein